MKSAAFMAVTFTGNRGSEMMLTSALGRLKELWPETVFHVFSYYAKEDRKAASSDPRLRIHGASPFALVFIFLPSCLLYWALRRAGLGRFTAFLPKRVLALAGAGVMLDAAGESFRDGRELFLLFNTMTLWPAFLLGVPVVKLSQSIGPVRFPWTRAAARGTLSRCVWTAARGKATKSYAEACRAGSALHEAADLGFLHRPEDSLPDPGAGSVSRISSSMEDLSRRHGIKWIGFCPSRISLFHARLRGRAYAAWYGRLIEYVYARGYGILLYPNASREGKNEWWRRNNDIPLLRNIARRLRDIDPDRLHTVDFPINSASIRGLINRCDLVFASRFHAMISSLVEGVPVIGMSRLHKFEEVLETFDLKEWIFEESSEREEDLHALFLKAVRNLGPIREKIRRTLPSARLSAFGQIEKVADLRPGLALSRPAVSVRRKARVEL